MPQGRKKVPFSGKAKKEQLRAKKQLKGGANLQGGKKIFLTRNSDNDESENEILKVNRQPEFHSKRGGRNVNRYVLQFHRETDAELKLLKEQALQTITPVSEKELEIDASDFYCDELDFPKRPPWQHDMTPEQLDAKEHKYFTEYIKKIESKFNWKDLGYFELNLETWRQLWRVLEMSDILLFIVDIRFAAAMFPPSLYDYVTNDLKKSMILVLNKIDLAPAPLVLAWKHYFKEKYPELEIVMFTSYPGYNLYGNTTNKGGLQTRRRRGKLRMAAEGAQKLHEACRTLVQDQVDLSSWHTKIMEEMRSEFENEDIEIGQEIETENDTRFFQHEKYKGGVLTIGCVGQPNVGKSSLMNAIMGKKVVSVSKTPGHTKHFQTIFLTNNVRLCDCPGLVFPSKVPKNIQVLMGTFPIAQLRYPYSAVKYIAERIDLPNVLRLQHPENDDSWSAMDICEAWAKKRGYLTAKAARPDTYRAANSLLRMQLEGKICVCLHPPEYSDKKDEWNSHPDLEMVSWIQAKSNLDDEATGTEIVLSESSDDEIIDSRNVKSEDETDDSNKESDSDDDDNDTPAIVPSHNPFAALAD